MFVPDHRLEQRLTGCRRMLVVLTTIVGFCYALLVVLPVYQSGLYRLSHNEILRVGRYLPFYGWHSPGIGVVGVVCFVFLILVPLWVAHLFTFLWKPRTVSIEQYVFWLVINLELLVFFLVSFPGSNALLTDVLD